jgi:hypothetical protein
LLVDDEARKYERVWTDPKYRRQHDGKPQQEPGEGGAQAQAAQARCGQRQPGKRDAQRQPVRHASAP